MQAQNDAVKSFRELLRYTLQEFQTKGGRLVLPVGCLYLEDWLLDALHVPKLIQLLNTEREVNLVQACEGPGGSALQRPAGPGPLALGGAAAIESPARVQQQNGTAPAQLTAEIDLQLPLPKTGLSEDILQLLACTLFIGCCSSYCSNTLTDDVRKQLKVDVHLTTSLESLLAAASSQQTQGGTSLEMVSILLQLGRPHHFESFEAFTEWRTSFAAIVSQSLILGAAEATSNERDKQAPSLRKQLLRMKMYNRVIAVPSVEDLDNEIYTEALDMFIGAAGGVAEASRVRVAELLMAAGFDASEGGQPVAEQEELYYILRHHLWPILNLPTSLHDLLNAWAYLRQFALTGNAALLDKGVELIETIRQRRHRGPRLQAATAASPEDESDDLVDGVMRAAAEWVTSRLARYRQFTGAGPVPELLGVLVACQKCLGEQSSIPEILENCIATSIRSEFERAINELLQSDSAILKDSRRIVSVAACCSEILDDEVSEFSPVFSQYVKMPAEIAAIEVHHCFNSYLLPFLQTVHTLEDSNLEAIRSAVGLESKLQTLMGERTADGLDWAILERLTPLLERWVSNQLGMVQSWYQRIFASENWQPVSQPRGCSRSAVELVKIVSETLEALFDLHLGIPEEVVTSAGEGLDSFLSRYAEQTASQLGSPEFMIPPLPGLTRYKKEVAIKAAAAQGQPTPQSTPRHGRSNSSLPEGALLGTPEQQHLASLPLTHFSVRMNSLEYIQDHLPAFSEIIAKRWGVSETKGPLWAETLFAHTPAACGRAIEAIAHFAATKIVYRDLAEPFSGLYIHEVQQSRINPLSDAVDEQLGVLCQSAAPDLHQIIAQNLLQTTLDAILRVLLHGGPNRWFKPSDVDLIEEDLEELRMLFHAEGDGIPLSEVQQMCSGVNDLLTVLQLDTEILIDNLKQARQREKMGVIQGKQPLAYDSQTLLQVLGHREDHAASKYLKKEFALPKKLDGGGALPGAKSFPTFGRKDSNSGTGFKKKLSFGNFGRK